MFDPLKACRACVWPEPMDMSPDPWLSNDWGIPIPNCTDPIAPCARIHCSEEAIWRLLGVALWQACSNMFGGGIAVTWPEQLLFMGVCVLGAIIQASVFGLIAKSL